MKINPIFIALFCLACSGPKSNNSGTAQNNRQCAGQAFATWDPVTVDFNGNAILVDGYRVYYGNTAGGPYPNMAPPTAQNQLNITNLCAGTYYFVVTAYMADIESGYSNEASKNFATSFQLGTESEPGAEFSLTIK